MSSSSHHHHDGLLNTIRKISLILAFVIGWLSQLATFALDFMAIHLAKAAREEQVMHDYKKDLMIEWCAILTAALVTASIGMVGIFYLHNLLKKYIIATTSCAAITRDSSSNSNNNGLVELLMDQVENRVVVGFLLGVTMAWLLWDFPFMGQQLKLHHYILIIVLLFFQFEGRRMPTTLLLQEEEGEARKKEEQFEYVALV